jgi:zinc transport system substrate-binding protein
MQRFLYLILIIFYTPAQETYVTTIFPFAAIISEITASEVTCLVKVGDSPHTHALRPSSVSKVTKADFFFYGHEHLDPWALDLPYNRIISLNALLPDAYQLSIMSYFGKSRGKILGEDPHFWMDPLAVNALIPHLVDTLCMQLPAKCAVFKENGTIFSIKLKRLTDILAVQLAPLQNKTVLLAHPFFQYYLSRFEINLAGIIEPIPGKEPTAKEIEEIIKVVGKNNVAAILVNEQLSDRSALLISEATGIPVIALDPIGGSAGRKSYAELLAYNTHQLLQLLK